MFLDLLYLKNTTRYTQAGKQSDFKWYESVSQNLKAVLYPPGEKSYQAAARAAGVSHRSSSFTSLISSRRCPTPRPPRQACFKAQKRQKETRITRDQAKHSPKSGIFKRCPVLPAWGGEPGLRGTRLEPRPTALPPHPPGRK